MNKQKFVGFISKLGFKKLEDKGWFEKFETDFKPEHEELYADGFNIKYTLSYRENTFHIGKVLEGGFFGNTTTDRIFSGMVENEEELATIFKCIKFK